MSQPNTEPSPARDAAPQPGAAPAPDWFLQQLVEFANKWGIESGITLQVGGILVSGSLISGAKYFEQFAAHYKSGFATDPEIGQALHKWISSYQDVYGKGAGEQAAASPPNYVHLRDARFYHPGQEPLSTVGVLWRGRIAEVDGFFLGVLA